MEAPNEKVDLYNGASICRTFKNKVSEIEDNRWPSHFHQSSADLLSLEIGSWKPCKISIGEHETNSLVTVSLVFERLRLSMSEEKCDEPLIALRGSFEHLKHFLEQCSNFSSMKKILSSSKSSGKSLKNFKRTVQNRITHHAIHL